jgi:acyl carrier protein
VIAPLIGSAVRVNVAAAPRCGRSERGHQTDVASWCKRCHIGAAGEFHVDQELVVALTRAELVEHVLDIVRNEAPRQDVAINLDTPVESVNIDSIDLINILFRLEDEYKVNIEMDLQERPGTVGALIDALIAYIPHDKDAQ